MFYYSVNVINCQKSIFTLCIKFIVYAKCALMFYDVNEKLSHLFKIMTKIIFPHLALGDNIICNGLIRNLASMTEECILITNPAIKDSIQFMYRDLTNMQYWFGWYEEAIRMINGLRIPNDNLVLIGDAGRGNVEKGFNFDAWFYHQHNLDFSHSFSNFFVARDLLREKSLLERFGISSDKYILLHEDPRYQIDKALIHVPDGFEVINISPSFTSNVFDWCMLIENSSELHCIESSIMFLADRLLYQSAKQPKLIAHRYAREYPPSNSPSLINNWVILGGGNVVG